MDRRDDLFTAQNQRIIELEADLSCEKMEKQLYIKIVKRLMAEQAVDRAKQTGAWEG